jgi:hypothetical protein
MAKVKKNARQRLTKVATMTYLEPAQAGALRALSARTRVPQQVYLREGLDYVLKKHARKS